MELTERKKQILRAIVDSYIRTAEPVGSKTISQLPGMDFSPATIRNEMADLTSMGFEQPHTSAGRVPSAAGYRLYVDELRQNYRLSMDETKTINQAMEVKMQEVDKMISQVGKLVSKMTDLPAYAVAARSSQRTVKRFDLILAETGSFILVGMLSDNQVQNKLIRLPLDVAGGFAASVRGSQREPHRADGGRNHAGASGKGHAQRSRCGKPGAGDCGLHGGTP